MGCQWVFSIKYKADPKWKKAIDEEMNALKKNETRNNC